MSGTKRIPMASATKIGTNSAAFNNRTNSKIPVNNIDASRWRNKYEEAEQKRKTLLTENLKKTRINDDIQKKYADLQEKYEGLETELFEQCEEFSKLSTASKNLYKEYETLKNQYDVETGAMSNALQFASKWYQENKELKRRTLLLDNDTVDEGVDDGESTHDADVENLNKTIKQLSNELAVLQTECDSLKHIEFLTSEKNSQLLTELEREKDVSIKLRSELMTLKKEYDQMLRVSEMMKKELKDLKELGETQRNDVVHLRKEAGDYRKERNILAHQSTLLLQGLSGENSDSENCLKLLQEIETIKRVQEEEQNRHEEEINILQERIDELSSNTENEVLEERFKLVEFELQVALERAEKAEKELENKKYVPPPPPPLPPPPPPSFASDRPVVPLRIKRKCKSNVNEPEETLDEQNEPKKPIAATGVNEDIINAIKEGNFTLRKTKQIKKERENSKTVSELLNILGTLRRAPKKRQSPISSP